MCLIDGISHPIPILGYRLWTIPGLGYSRLKYWVFHVADGKDTRETCTVYEIINAIKFTVQPGSSDQINP